MESRFSGEEIVRWSLYWQYRDRQYDKLDHYALTLIGTIAGIVGADIDLDDYRFGRNDDEAEEYMTAEQLFDLFAPLGATKNEVKNDKKNGYLNRLPNGEYKRL